MERIHGQDQPAAFQPLAAGAHVLLYVDGIVLRRRFLGHDANRRERRYRVVHVDEGFDVKKLKVGPADQPLVEKLQSRFMVAYRHEESTVTHAPPTNPGSYDVFVSVGQRDGTPQIAMPLPFSDSHRRYKVGHIRLK